MKKVSLLVLFVVLYSIGFSQDFGSPIDRMKPYLKDSLKVKKSIVAEERLVSGKSLLITSAEPTNVNDTCLTVAALALKTNVTDGQLTFVLADSSNWQYVNGAYKLFETGGESLWSEQGSDIYFNNGSVGINTDLIDSTLTVKGGANIQDNLLVWDNATIEKRLRVDSTISIKTDPAVFIPDQRIHEGTIYYGNFNSSLLNIPDTISSDYNTYVGFLAGDSATKAKQNTGIGYKALFNTETGWANTAVGYQALMSGEGDGWLRIPTNAGVFYANVAVGGNSMAATTTGSYNTAVGVNSLLNNTEGTNNVALGIHAMNDNLTGTNNLSVGNRALYKNTSGSANIAIGYFASYTQTTPSYNIAIGYNALYYNAQQGSLIAIGKSALYNNATNGTSNYGIGENVLLTNTTGDYNLAYGYSALRLVSTTSNNTGIGHNAGYNCTGANNMFLGYYAGYRQTTGNNKIIIDNYGDRASAAAELTDSPIAIVTNAAVASQTIALNGKTSIGANFIMKTGSITDNDATPDVSAANIFIYSGSANAVNISDLDNPVVGAIYYLIGNSDTYTMTVGGANFKMAGGASAVLGQYDTLVLYVLADNNYIEISRTNYTP